MDIHFSNPLEPDSTKKVHGQVRWRNTNDGVELNINTNVTRHAKGCLMGTPE